MMIKCDECGHDNQLGAIFCRECGAKLDVETIRPQVRDKSGPGMLGIIRKVISGLILLVLLYVLGMMFYPESPGYKPLAEAQETKVKEKFQALLNRIDGRYGEDKYVFTPDEVTYLYSKELTEKTVGDAGTYAIENMYFSVDSKNFIHIMMQSKLAGKLPVTFAVKGVLLEDSTQFRVVNAKMGHLSMPKFLRDKVSEKFTPGIDEGMIRQIIDSSKDFRVENGDFVVELKKAK
ncbi:MAG: zinc ribbon domain-containing protein [Victivallales bacterium]|nr:zinc ribbon domain-containing protein [Victivallales bacterium]